MKSNQRMFAIKRAIKQCLYINQELPARGNRLTRAGVESALDAVDELYLAGANRFAHKLDDVIYQHVEKYGVAK
ncbi:hypothetical protein [Pseudoalteromonas maricaloris]|uniref:hypothetical protein n=1 Tax=Pseudoalteromonas maricaloris TaxID=184924 RepID=UPI00057C8DEE|nr:hypothetical protein [Pseudoalteromonas flavipulchra]KID38057.1 hypothetical protein QT15_04635 [Pseudoalteromonas flavipulchra NCIMB 2033 = ATCC BAA-314]MBD0782774.1 hypothetical protein [Pseudoalteromonas flavipulchra]MBE0372363.1 hypothetical protein [Pseudoalteromonas flavipulchra NCIMB 2033 = ATCC BAA-314]